MANNPNAPGVFTQADCKRVGNAVRIVERMGVSAPGERLKTATYYNRRFFARIDDYESFQKDDHSLPVYRYAFTEMRRQDDGKGWEELPHGRVVTLNSSGPDGEPALNTAEANAPLTGAPVRPGEIVEILQGYHDTDHKVDYTFSWFPRGIFGRVVCSGPCGEKDRKDNRYWVQLVYPGNSDSNQTTHIEWIDYPPAITHCPENMTGEGSIRPLIMSAENLAEQINQTHLISPGVIVPLMVEIDLSDPPVLRYTIPYGDLDGTVICSEPSSGSPSPSSSSASSASTSYPSHSYSTPSGSSGGSSGSHHSGSPGSNGGGCNDIKDIDIALAADGNTITATLTLTHCDGSTTEKTANATIKCKCDCCSSSTTPSDSTTPSGSQPSGSMPSGSNPPGSSVPGSSGDRCFFTWKCVYNCSTQQFGPVTYVSSSCGGTVSDWASIGHTEVGCEFRKVTEAGDCTAFLNGCENPNNLEMPNPPAPPTSHDGCDCPSSSSSDYRYGVSAPRSFRFQVGRSSAQVTTGQLTADRLDHRRIFLQWPSLRTPHRKEYEVYCRFDDNSPWTLLVKTNRRVRSFIDDFAEDRTQYIVRMIEEDGRITDTNVVEA